MDTPQDIFQIFPQLTQHQREQIEALGALYADWNAKINVISRKDIDNLYAHHVMHSLFIGKFVTPAAGSAVMDLGCGGGFPGIPLAILWPDVQFHLIDRVGKKIRVAGEVANAIGLTNVTLQHGDALECHEKFDFVVSRAVMALPDLIKLARRSIARRQLSRLPNGLICLKGGELDAEMQSVKTSVIDVPLTDWTNDEFYINKRLIYCRL